MILAKLEVGSFAANCYLVGAESDKEGIIVDPGAEADKIGQKVQDLGLKVQFIVLTHAHIDHVGALKEIKEATGAKVAIHADDAGGLQRRRSSNPLSGFAFPVLPPPDQLLKDGDSLDIGDLRFWVLHTPGHTPGGICLLGEGVVFSGDTLFNLSIGRTDMPGGSYAQLMNSIQTKLMALPDSTVVYPGHGAPTTIGIERQRNPFLRT